MKDDTLPLRNPEMSMYHTNYPTDEPSLINTTSYTNPVPVQVFQEPQYPPPAGPSLSQKFEVFCDDSDGNVGPARTLSMEKGEQSSSTHSGSLMHKVAKEKENIHKFPIADMELMEECGVAPVPDISVQQSQYNDYETYSHMQNHPGMYSQHPHNIVQPVSMASHDMQTHSHGSRQPSAGPVSSHVLTQLTPVSSSHSAMHYSAPLSHGIGQPDPSSEGSHEMLLPPAPTHGLVQPGPTLNQVCSQFSTQAQYHM